MVIIPTNFIATSVAALDNRYIVRMIGNTDDHKCAVTVQVSYEAGGPCQQVDGMS